MVGWLAGRVALGGEGGVGGVGLERGRADRNYAKNAQLVSERAPQPALRTRKYKEGRDETPGAGAEGGGRGYLDRGRAYSHLFTLLDLITKRFRAIQQFVPRDKEVGSGRPPCHLNINKLTCGLLITTFVYIR